ncbi:hypothetical protein FNF31_05539 [Cafeteria roenbergensis]|uniref:AMP deaminase n=1 Tax=Cafeteria roenbergensis TaxID=33653 RepID=A0A5A8CZZ2_CAFRO|nr:hypothetical protein FNF31_05539 [Cafeteria roenbergensis]
MAARADGEMSAADAAVIRARSIAEAQAGSSGQQGAASYSGARVSGAGLDDAFGRPLSGMRDSPSGGFDGLTGRPFHAADERDMDRAMDHEDAMRAAHAEDAAAAQRQRAGRIARASSVDGVSEYGAALLGQASAALLTQASAAPTDSSAGRPSPVGLPLSEASAAPAAPRGRSRPSRRKPHPATPWDAAVAASSTAPESESSPMVKASRPSPASPGLPDLSPEDERLLFSCPSVPALPARAPLSQHLAAAQNEVGPRGSAIDMAVLGLLPTDAAAKGDARVSGTVGPTGAATWLRGVPAEQPGAFQRVAISGADSLSSEEEDACRYLARALRLRQKHVYKKPANYWGSIPSDVAPHVARRSALFGAILQQQGVAEVGSDVLQPEPGMFPEADAAAGQARTADVALDMAAAAAASKAVAGRGHAVPAAAANPGDLPLESTSQLSLDAPKLSNEELASLLGLPKGSDVSRYRELFHRRRPAIPYDPLATADPGRITDLGYRWVDGVLHVFDAAELAEAEAAIEAGAAATGAGAAAGPAAAAGGADSGHGPPGPHADASRSPSPGRRSRHAEDQHPLLRAGLTPVHAPPSTLEEFLADYGELCKIIHSAHVKSFAWLRLELLEKRFDLHRLLNGQRESDEQKTVPHRDFYNVRKVDTHVHHSACMNQKHLLRFIKHKLRYSPDEVVARTKDGKPETLAEVFAELGLSAYDLSVDTLDMQADSTTYHRFDRFNLKYNPIGQSKLRGVFLKSDNEIKGRYLAEVTQEVFSDLEASKYQSAEYRISIYGRKPTEWSTLAAWVVDNKLVSPNVRWLIQVPRLFQLYKSSKMLDNFQQMLTYLFEPLIKVTLDPSSDPKLHQFLTTVVGFDCVDDESKQEGARDAEVPHPSEWDMPFNPPYFYWMYYLSANLNVINNLRASRGLSTFSFRPHGGEAGDGDHMAACFLTAESVNHGITMRRSPSLQYLYYLDQVGLAMSPLSNNRLFVDYSKNPFFKYFQRGLNVSLSTDDPLLLHYTREALVEEYCVAGQVFKLTSVDMCEVARASVLQSGFEHPYKSHFIGESYALPGPRGNDIFLTNVPSVRLQFRLETLRSERALVAAGARRALGIHASPPPPVAAAPPLAVPAVPGVKPSAQQPAPGQQHPSAPRIQVTGSSTPASGGSVARTPPPQSPAIAGAVAPAAASATPPAAHGSPADPASGSRQTRPQLGRAVSPVSRAQRASVRVRSARRSVDGRSYTVYTVPPDGSAPIPASPAKAASPARSLASSMRSPDPRTGTAPSQPEGGDDDDSAVRGGRI